MIHQPMYGYDVFISYSHLDKQWVRSDLLSSLESKGYKVCIDHRDFEAGVPSVQEMRRAVETSRKTLLVLSQQYLDSGWAEFEYLMLQVLDPANRQRRLIPLRKAECLLPPEINYLTYVDFADLKNQEIEWKKLLTALGTPLKQQTVPPAPSAAAIEPVEEVSRSAQEGLEALVELMAHPAVQTNVAFFKAIFQTSCIQIDTLGYYKDLHDLLHTLQFKCCNYILGVIRSAKREPDDLSIWDDVVNYELTLQDVVEGLNKSAQQKDYAQNVGPWIQGLIGALGVLFQAVNNCDVNQVETAIRPIIRVLARRPVEVNTRLNEAAHTLHMPELVEALTRVRTKLDGAQINSEAVGKFKEGVAALDKLNVNLTLLVNDHNQWQRLDVESRWIEVTIGQGLDDLLSSWPDLQEMTLPLCDGITEAWAQLLMEDCEKLDGAIAAADPARTKQFFGRFRSRISNRFYQVDLILKGLCGELRSVGKPLATVLEIIS